jgi:hypothetical protein
VRSDDDEEEEEPMQSHSSTAARRRVRAGCMSVLSVLMADLEIIEHASNDDLSLPSDVRRWLVDYLTSRREEPLHGVALRRVIDAERQLAVSLRGYFGRRLSLGDVVGAVALARAEIDRTCGGAQ